MGVARLRGILESVPGRVVLLGWWTSTSPPKKTLKTHQQKKGWRVMRLGPTHQPSLLKLCFFFLFRPVGQSPRDPWRQRSPQPCQSHYIRDIQLLLCLKREVKHQILQGEEALDLGEHHIRRKMAAVLKLSFASNQTLLVM